MNTREEIIEKVNKLVDAYKQGLLGGEQMPEDENPGLEKSSTQNYMYFTLPMALNYQRNSYVLWECVMILATPGQHSCNTRTNVPTTSGQAFLNYADIHS